MIDYSNDGWFCCLVFAWRGSVIPMAMVESIPSAIIVAFLMYFEVTFDEFQQKADLDSLSPSQLWAAFSASLLFLISFRTNTAYSRFWEGTTLLHQMFGEWFDAASCLIAFSTLDRKKKAAQVADFRATLVRLFSLLHGTALEEIALTDSEEFGYPSLDTGGLDRETLKYLAECKSNPALNFNRVEVLIHMIQNLVVNAQDDGAIKIPPPILSRVFQTISRGQVNLANCKKITSTLFPFPYAQLIALLLFVFRLGTPAVMASICTSQPWGIFFTIVPVFCLYALNLVATELELPFGSDPNDLPLQEFQEHMNTSLVMLSHDNVDNIPHTVKTMNFRKLQESTTTLRPSCFISKQDEVEVGKDQDPVPSSAPAPAPAPPPPVAAPAPAPAAAAPAAAPLTAAAVEQAALTGVGQLMTKFEDLTEQLCKLSQQVSQHTEILSKSSRCKASTVSM
eukprot:TRINITY_DN26362_c0_g1_i1.p1 TRINITY_DN26362_c0_g1~~TRINITY_DN26362_c0_g1_i1.p1  ORF type:complete len:452 (+),score=77.52 TRINITY_DN26362_c0_g1_i1:79-1434(+)